MEWWNDGILVFNKDINHFNFILNSADGGTINPTLHYPRTHYSTIPAFQHSNWGEAPNLFSVYFSQWQDFWLRQTLQRSSLQS
jgi:hypothetical protein